MNNSKKNTHPYNKNNIVYLDIIRIIACFMVIINHTIGYVLNDNNFINSTFYCVLFSICKIGVPLFLMITGALVLDKSYTYRKIFKCIIKVLVPILGLSFIFYIIDNGITNINLLSFFKIIISKPYILPYWYIYALIGIYLTIPFLQKMTKNFKINDYVAFIIIFLIIPSLITSLSSFINIDISYNFKLAFFPVIISVVVCGEFISKIKLSKKYFIFSILIFFVSYILMFLLMYLPYLDKKTISYILDYWDAFPVLLMSIAVFYNIRFLFENRVLSNTIKNLIYIVSSTTFGIYLIHGVLHKKLYKLIVMKFIFNYNSILGTIILIFTLFIVCMIIICILKRIPIIKKFL